MAERRRRLLVALLLAAAVALLALLAGPAGAKLTFRKVASKELEAKDEVSVRAKCSSGARRHLISGGFASDSPLTDGARSTIAAFRSSPSGARGWKLGAGNFRGDPAKVAASVLCSKIDPQVRVRSSIVDAPAGSETKAVARCHKGEEAIAGGFSAPESRIGRKKPEVIAIESRRSTRRKWRVLAYNNAGDADGELKAVALCSALRPDLQTVELEGTAVDQAPVELRPRCPRGEQLWSGGFRASFKSFDPFAAVIADSSYADRRHWVTRFVGYQAGGPIKAFAYCRPAT